VLPLPLPTENEQWKKNVVRKAWVTSVAFTFIEKKIVLRKAWVTSVALTFTKKKMFSRKHGSRVWPLPLLTENEQCKRLFPQRMCVRLRWIVRPGKIHVEDHI
jgi:hypothetical protein